ncbi:MAG: arsenite efflux MFS transporter ArsK [Hyphomicrobiales bacterium]|nr:arsenite efflux MFS transporter ArsK [Hyphomicrobiales bacterium]
MSTPQSGSGLISTRPHVPLTPPRPAASAAIVWSLGATQVIGYGTLYYAFSILAAGMAKDFNWTVDWVYGVFSAALLTGGLAAPFAGRWVDRFGAGQIMAAGSVVSAIALAGCALAHSPALFVLGLVAIEVAATLVLYDAAFAALAQLSGQNARRSITHLTLIAGFASTLFWPLTSYLNDWIGWRDVYFVFAGLHVAVCLPIHLMLARQTSGQPAPVPPEMEHFDIEARGSLAEADRVSAFRLILLGFTLSGFVLSALLIHMVPLLTALGFGATGLLMASLFGPAQVFVRVTNMAFGGNLHPVNLAIIASAMLPIAVTLLIAASEWAPAALLFALLFGFGSGLTSIVRGTVPLALFGAHGYGARLGNLTAVRLIVTSIAPFIFAWIMQNVGVAAALWTMAALGTLAVFVFAALARTHLKNE